MAETFDDLRVRADRARVLRVLKHPDQLEDLGDDEQFDRLWVHLAAMDDQSIEEWLSALETGVLFGLPRKQLATLATVVTEAAGPPTQRALAEKIIDGYEHLATQPQSFPRDLDDAEDALEVIQEFLAGRNADGLKSPHGLDQGVALLLPITIDETRAVESVLSCLWDAIQNDSLTEAEAAQIQLMAELLKTEHQAAEPGRTERWRVLGPLRSGLAFLRKDLPRDALAWMKLKDIADEAGWTDFARELAEAAVGS